MTAITWPHKRLRFNIEANEYELTNAVGMVRHRVPKDAMTYVGHDVDAGTITIEVPQ